MNGDPVGRAALTVVHETEVRYSTQVALAQHLAYLRPLDDDAQALENYQLRIEPEPASRGGGPDTFGNLRTYFALYAPHQELRVRSESRVRLRARFDTIDADASPGWEQVRTLLQYQAGAPYFSAAEFCFASPFVPRAPALRDYAQPSFKPERPLLAAALDLMHRIHGDFRYQIDSTKVSTPVLQAFEERTGVCQDFSHVMIGCLRSLGLPARYVSGYLRTHPSPGQPRLVGADASHAWVSAWCPVNGWVDLDPTNDLVPGLGHVRLAVGRDYSDVAPLRGVVQGGGEHALRVAVQVSAADGD